MSRPPQRPTRMEEAILRDLLTASTYGFDLVKRGVTTRGTSSNYLTTLARRGYVAPLPRTKQPTAALGPARKVYAITTLGRRLLRAVDASNEAYAATWNEAHECKRAIID